MATMHGGSFSKTSLRASRLILMRKAIFPSAAKTPHFPMSTPITTGDDILDSIWDFMLLLLFNAASRQRLAQLGKQPVHPIRWCIAAAAAQPWMLSVQPLLRR